MFWIYADVIVVKQSFVPFSKQQSAGILILIFGNKENYIQRA